MGVVSVEREKTLHLHLGIRTTHTRCENGLRKLNWWSPTVPHPHLSKKDDETRNIYNFHLPINLHSNILYSAVFELVYNNQQATFPPR